jgi:hypothetical protein
MVMVEKSFPQQLASDLKELFVKPKELPAAGVPGSELPAPGKCGCHPGGIHPSVEVHEAEQRDPVELHAIPVTVKNIVTVQTTPAKRGTMETFYPGATGATAIICQGADPRIKRVTFSVSVQGCWFGSQEAIKALTVGSAVAGQGLFLAAVGPYVWEGIHEDLWIMAATAGSIVSARREYWTDI